MECKHIPKYCEVYNAIYCLKCKEVLKEAVEECTDTWIYSNLKGGEK